MSLWLCHCEWRSRKQLSVKRVQGHDALLASSLSGWCLHDCENWADKDCIHTIGTGVVIMLLLTNSNMLVLYWSLCKESFNKSQKISSASMFLFIDNALWPPNMVLRVRLVSSEQTIFSTYFTGLSKCRADGKQLSLQQWSLAWWACTQASQVSTLLFIITFYLNNCMCWF